ncbi:MAG: hypothetical protein A2Z99_11725 [Treponema sp. GWB1_62_6]|nr:MAG: hypothetical protein A2Z99_11725 [Treponema sp. GWB1_62_6]
MPASEKLDVVCGDLDLHPVLAVLFPFILAHIALDSDKFTLREILVQGLGSLAPKVYIPEIRFVDPLVALLHPRTRRDRKMADSLARIGVLELGIAGKPADEDSYR